MTSLTYLVSQYPAANHTFILREIRGLRARGFDVGVISIRACDRPLDLLTSDEREEQARTRYLKTAGFGAVATAHLATLVSRPWRYIRGLLYAVQLGGLDLRKILYNCLYFAEAVVAGRWMLRQGRRHAHAHFTSTVALLLARVFPVTISMTIHGPDEFTDPVGFYLRQKVKASRFVCAISQYGRSQLMRWTTPDQWEKLSVCYLGVDPAVFTSRPAAKQAGPFRLLFVGRLAPVKAQHILIGAVDRLIRQGRQVRLRLVGDGPDRETLHVQIERRGLSAVVTLEGRMNQDQVLDLYRQTDCFALASFAEGIPVVLMEAMAMEIPCVATGITGIPELIRDEREGLLVPPSDEAALAQAIARLMDDPGLCRRLGEAARRRVLEEFDLGRNVAELAQTFHTHLSG